MLKYNLAFAFRSIKRNLSFSLINISGLAIGLTLAIILLQWIDFELSFDRFHEKADRIYRVVAEFERETGPDNFAHTPAPLGQALVNDIPEISDFVRLTSLGKNLVNYEDKQFLEEIELADPSLFRIFSFSLISGNPETALNDPGSIIVSQSGARKFFGSADPLGKTLFVGNNRVQFVVTGVMADIPVNSQIRFDFLGSFSRLKNNLSWGSWNYDTYILTGEKRVSALITDKLQNVLKKNSKGDKTKLHLQQLTSIHLQSNLRSDLSSNRNIKTIYLLGSICFLVLVVASINYMNLATARYTRRGKEVGLRKVTGASGANIIKQFLFESFAITLCAFILALFISLLIIPAFSSVTGIPLQKESLFYFKTLIKFLPLLILISLISGSYPAIMLSSVNPVSAIRDDFRFARTVSVKSIRKVLIIFQFAVSIVLITCTLIIYSQMAFIRKKDLGLNPDQVVVLPMYQAEIRSMYELLKKEILMDPRVLNATAVCYWSDDQTFFQNARWEGLKENSDEMINWLSADKDFLKTLKIELIKGEDFSSDIANGQSQYILNESALKKIGWEDPIGKSFEILGINRPGKVTGVVKDFNFKTLHYEIAPVAIVFNPEDFDNLLIKISAKDVTGTLSSIRSKWKSLFPNYPFEYSFMSDDFQKQYEKETMTLKIVTYVSIMVLFISCIGLFGLVLFTIESRMKEIGLRKVSGSSSGGIVIMLNMEFVKWIIVSFIISCPIIIYFMQKWLANFAFRINLSWWMFLLAGLITTALSLVTVSWQTWYSATRNPSDCLRQNQ